MSDELEYKLEKAFINGDLEYFAGQEFIKDLAELGWGLEDLPSTITTIKDKEGTWTMVDIWPAPKSLRLMRVLISKMSEE